MTNQALQTMSTSEWGIMREQATMLVKSKFLPPSIKTAEEAIAIILMGRELNINAMASLQTINIIQNKPTVSPQLMLALINRSGQLEDVRLETGVEGAICTMKRKGRAPYTARFGPAEAKAMNLDGKDNYKKQAPTMFKWRAVADAARTVFPDVVLGLYTPEEMGAEVEVRENGEMFVTAPLTEPAPAERAVASLPAATAHEDREPDERARLVEDCGRLFRQMNDAGHLPKWTNTTVATYINNKFIVANGIDVLTIEDLQILKSDLFRQLDALRAEQVAERSLAGRAGGALDRAAEASAPLMSEEDRERARLVARIESHLAELGWEHEDVTRYLRDHQHGVALKDMSLDQLLAICDDHEIETAAPVAVATAGGVA